MKNTELIESLTREELIEVIKQLGAAWVFNPDHMPKIIRHAKAIVLRSKANAAFAQWEALSKLSQGMPKETFDQQVAWAAKFEEEDRFYKKYVRLWGQADLLEFGPRKKGER